MKAKRLYPFLVLCLLFFPVSRGSTDTFDPGDSPGPPLLVGHITHLEGQLLRYVPEDQDWVATVKDSPFGLDDTLYTGRNSRAEIILPNGIWIRLNGQTQIQIIALEEESTEIDLYSGTARFYHQGSGTMKVYTPFGYVLASPGTVFDLHSREKVAEVLALRGELEFMPAGSQAKYRVAAGAPALVAEGRQVFSGSPAAEPRWQAWNLARDQASARYRDYPGESARYLPPELEYQAPILDENGRWEQVPYQGEVYYFWRPFHVGSGWAPFTVGRWTVWYDDPCWIPAEPFGYVTHHYGNWLLIRGFWYWAPPIARTRIRPLRVSLFPIAWAWYPGRVAWIHHSATIGWIPLAPHEPYYCRRHWGPRAVVVKNQNAPPINLGRYHHADQAVTVHRNNFFAVTNYRPVRLPPPKRENIVKDFRPLPVLDRPFLAQADPLRQKNHFTPATIREKPGPASMDRIRFNQARFQETERTNKIPEPPAAEGVPLKSSPALKPAIRPPVTQAPGSVRDKSQAERFRRTPAIPPALREDSVSVGLPRAVPGDGLPSKRLAPPGSSPGLEREGKKIPPEAIKTVPSRQRTLELQDPPEIRQREIPERKKEPAAPPIIREEQSLREVYRVPAVRSETPGDYPVKKGRSIIERFESSDRMENAEPGVRPSREFSPRGKERSGEKGGNGKER